jgi:hypothetical protein
MVGSGGRVRFAAVVFQNGVANSDAFVADVGPGVITGGRNEFGYGILRLMAKRAAKCFFRRPRLHIELLKLSGPLILPWPAVRLK